MMKARMLRVLVVLLFAAAVMPVAAQQQSLRVVATTTQAGDLAWILAGGLTEITTLMGAGVDPHLYEPTEADVAAMNAAELVVYSGLHLEGQFDAVFAALGERDVRVVALAEPVEDGGFVLQFEQGGALVHDPHFWFDPRNWQLSVQAFADVLAEMDPTNAETYFARAEAYVAQLDLLYAWALDAMSQVPEAQRIIITSHDAFQYFGDAFGWTMVAVQGISTADEASVRDIQDVVDFVYERRIPAVFVESSVPVDTIEAVLEGVNQRAQADGVDFEVRLGVRELYSDAMGQAGAFGGTYVGMLASNVITILQSFGYEIPQWPDGLEPLPPLDQFELE